MKNFPLISTVILNWNGKEYLYPCLQSVKGQTYPNIEIVLVDNASTVVHHHHSKKFGTYSPMKAFLVERNRIWVAWKNFPLPILCLWPFYTLWRYFYQGFGTVVGRGASGRFGQGSSLFSLIPILIKAYLSGLKGLPQILRKRKGGQSKKRIWNQECYHLFKKYGMKAREIAFKE
jgi:hypothetical protein